VLSSLARLCRQKVRSSWTPEVNNRRGINVTYPGPTATAHQESIFALLPSSPGLVLGTGSLAERVVLAKVAAL